MFPLSRDSRHGISKTPYLKRAVERPQDIMPTRVPYKPAMSRWKDELYRQEFGVESDIEEREVAVQLEEAEDEPGAAVEAVSILFFVLCI